MLVLPVGISAFVTHHLPVFRVWLQSSPPVSIVSLTQTTKNGAIFQIGFNDESWLQTIPLLGFYTFVFLTPRKGGLVSDSMPRGMKDTPRSCVISFQNWFGNNWCLLFLCFVFAVSLWLGILKFSIQRAMYKAVLIIAFNCCWSG